MLRQEAFRMGTYLNPGITANGEALNSVQATAKQKPVFYKALYLLLSFFIPFLIITLGMIALHVEPFGDHSLAISDGKGYVYGLPDHARLIQGKEDWLYSLRGMGTNRWSSLAWGGIHPVKALALFAKPETAPAWLAWISAVNLSLCGLSMYLLLAGVRGHRASHLLFSTSYALIGFNVVNCYHMLFFIGPQLLPLTLLGLLRIRDGKSPLLYILSLGTCILLNFYFGFHLCVASALLFAAFLMTDQADLKRGKKEFACTWLFSSLIAGLLPTFVWLPTIKAFTGGGRLNQTGLSEYQFQENMPFLQIFSKLFSGANSTGEMVNGLPNIFCGILVTALVILFFMNRNIPVGRKRAAGVILSFYLVTFYIKAFTLAMHGGTHTNWFPYRYSYVFSFLLIMVAAEEFEHLEELTADDAKRCGTALLIAAILVFSTRYSFVSGGAVLLDLSLLFFMWLGFWLYKTKPESAPKRTLILLLLLLVSGNLYANYVLSLYKVREWELDLKEYQENVLKYGSLIDAVRTADPDFYRMEKETPDLGSLAADAGFYDYYGVGASGPSIRMFTHRELQKLGINWFDMRHWYSEGIPAATDSLLGLKYLISERDLAQEKDYTYRVEVNGAKLYQNPHALSVAVLSNDAVQELELGENVFDNLNLIWKSMTGGSEDIFTAQKDITFTARHALADQPVTSAELEGYFSRLEQELKGEGDEQSIKPPYIAFSFTAGQDGPVYTFDTSIPGSANGLVIPSIRTCGYYEVGDTVNGEIDLTGTAFITDDYMRGYCANMAFASADNGVLADYAAILNGRDISLSRVRDSLLTGSFDAEADQCILFTIPWDEGWTCYIDGEKVPIEKTWDLFMSVEAPQGRHSYELKFFPAWMDYGLYISAAALAGFAVLMLVWKKQRKAAQAAANTAAPGAPEQTEAAAQTEEIKE